MRLKSHSGLGDGIYLYEIAKYFKNQGKPIEIMTNYPELYTTLKVKTMSHRAYGVMPDLRISYVSGKENKTTNQFQDLCSAAGISVPLVLDMRDRQIANQAMCSEIRGKAGDKKLCIVSAPHAIFGRDDGFGKEIDIDYKVMNDAINVNKNWIYFVQVGNKPVYNFDIDYNMADETSVSDVLDLCQISDYCFGQIGWVLPVAEAFWKYAIIVYSYKVKTVSHHFLKSINPSKTITRKDLVWPVYDNEPDKLKEVFNSSNE